MKLLLLALEVIIATAILIIGIEKVVNYFRGKHPVDYGYAIEHVNVLLSFPSFKAFYLAAPEKFNLGDETVYFREDAYRGRSYGYGERTRIGFKTLKDLWDYQEWHNAIDEKQREARYDEATLTFCNKMSRILEEKKQVELEKAQKAAQEVQSRFVMQSNEWPHITLAKGDDSGDVLLLQNLLADAGFGGFSKDRALGIFGEGTATAVRVFRLSHNLGNSDIATPEVIKVLQEEAKRMTFIRAK